MWKAFPTQAVVATVRLNARMYKKNSLLFSAKTAPKIFAKTWQTCIYKQTTQCPEHWPDIGQTFATETCRHKIHSGTDKANTKS